MRWKLSLVVALLVTLCVNPSAADDTGLQFDEGGSLKVDPKVENTYEIPEISAGFNWDSTTGRVRGIVTMEVLDGMYLENVPLLETFPLKIDSGVGEDLVLTTFNIRFTSVIEVSGGLSYGYDFQEREPAVGVNFLMTRF